MATPIDKRLLEASAIMLRRRIVKEMKRAFDESECGVSDLIVQTGMDAGRLYRIFNEDAEFSIRELSDLAAAIGYVIEIRMTEITSAHLRMERQREISAIITELDLNNGSIAQPGRAALS